ncbi:MAG: N-acetylmuramic acid 6-phosphate etherase [Bacteroidota bacterium]|nr:N-acetylmuramic acid 6-phosphate etherase [Bacteroidota bacterium]MEC7949886.1 N-acetylmuramic acid 6-phosphate etherase [Bacteroidota bacterium]MEC8369117.1 N-acetylmuramic acid 6-phosphate etherase [Bacteroidota bacterium]HBS19389.1 N-acetylmuramic acid 6-phosphate etherase [Flavobacteriales bacterium]|tara:strand:- start:296 stop:1126 length:831 start_codon:yes stop_codon:yes gene_type:complete
MERPLPPTEQSGPVEDLHTLSVRELLDAMHRVDDDVQSAVLAAMPALTALTEALVDRMREGGRLFYLGAGTSGRLGVVDASECPPTFGVASDRVVGIMAGGDSAIRAAVEGAEDDAEQGWKDLKAHGIQAQDTVVGIAASGRTPYVIGALRQARLRGVLTGCVTCNPESQIIQACDHPVVAVTGPEFVTGSTRMKAGTATKLILNRLTTATMIQLGHVHGNRMVDMQLTNAKLMQRGARMVAEATGLGLVESEALLTSYGSVRAAVDAHQQGHART